MSKKRTLLFSRLGKVKRWKLSKKQKFFIPIYLFRRRMTFPPIYPPYSPGLEIETESTGAWFITEQSSSAVPTYIITE